MASFHGVPLESVLKAANRRGGGPLIAQIHGIFFVGYNEAMLTMLRKSTDE
jgi:hypothetical protein